MLFQNDKFGVLFDRFCNQVKADPNEISFSLNGRDLKRTDSVESAGLTITSFIDASQRLGGGNDIEEQLPDLEDDLVELKVQSSDRKLVEMIKIRPNDRFEVLMQKYAEAIGAKFDSIRYMFCCSGSNNNS